MKKKQIVFLLICTLFEFCHSKNEKRIFHTEYFSNGKIKLKEVWINKDSGTYIDSFYQGDGSFSAALPHKNNKLNGLAHYFKMADSLDEFFTYKDGIESGKCFAYYKNGNLAYETQKKDGKIIGQLKRYRRDKSIEIYEVFDNSGNFKYSREYDISGKITKEKGNGFVDAIYNDTIVKRDSEFYVIYVIATPPNCNEKLTIKIYDNENKLIDSSQRNAAISEVRFAHHFKNSGNFKVEAFLEILDRTTLKNKQSSLDLNIMVR